MAKRATLPRVWIGVCCVLAVAPVCFAQEKTADQKPEKKVGWFNDTELSVVVTEGNSATQSVGLKNTLRKNWEKLRFRFKLDFVRTDTTDDRFLLVSSGITFEPGEIPTDLPSSLVDPPLEPDVEKIFLEARFDREISKRVFWNAGGSWDRNVDAGILSRYIAFGGLGNLWVEHPDLKFSTTYGGSFTDREEDQPDPKKEEQFMGLRLGVDLRMKLGELTSYQHEMTGNMSLADANDYSFDITNAFTVVASEHLSLKLSLQWQFNHEPALEDVDLIARVDLLDPDGIPGNGDEFFQTVASGGFEITVGEDRTRKEQLDTVFRTTLVIGF